MTDYERSLRNDALIVFPTVQLHGCWFHFVRAEFRISRALNLYSFSADITKAIKMAMVLPLLPANLISEGITAVETESTTSPENFQRFCSYLRNTWLSENISVFLLPNRTNNAVESVHRSLFRIVGRAHPNIWMFISFLQKDGKWQSNGFKPPTKWNYFKKISNIK